MELKSLFIISVVTIVLLLSFKRPIIGLYFYLALVFIRPQDDRPNLADMRLPYVMLITLSILYLFKLNKTHTLFPKTKLFVPYVVFFLLMSFSVLIGIPSELSSAEWNVFVINLVTFIFIYSYINNEKDMKNVFLLIVLFGIYFSYLAIFKGSDCIETQDGLGCGRRNFVKININFGQPNYLGLTMAVMIFFSLALLKTYKNFLLKLFFSGVIVIFSYVMIKTGSRGAAVAFGLGILYYVYKEQNTIRNLSILFIITIITMSVVPVEYMDRLGTLGAVEEDESAMSRIDLWKTGLDIIVQYPFFGVGIGNFVLFAPNTPHNAYLQVASEMGIITFIAWIWLLFRTLRQTESHFVTFGTADKHFLRNASLALKVSIVVVMAQAMTTGLAHREFLYILISLVAVLERLSVTSAEDDTMHIVKIQ